MRRVQVFHSHTVELLQRAYVFTHISLERKCFWAGRGCRGCLYVLVLQHGFLLSIYSYFSIVAAASCTFSLSLCLFALFLLPSSPLVRLKFYASTGCVRIGFWFHFKLPLCRCTVCVCVCCATTPRWMLTMRFD